MRICSLSVPPLKHEWNQTVWSVNNLRCGTAVISQHTQALDFCFYDVTEFEEGRANLSASEAFSFYGQHTDN